MEINDKTKGLLHALHEKYKAEGQDMESYLEGLLYTGYLDYWDYTNADTLLSLQQPKTDMPDEMIFIIYHQITELYFKLSLWEIDQIVSKKDLDSAFFIARLTRISNYFINLTHSFDIMIQGMEKEQFTKFRLALLPASGFQSAQYRMIEIACTDLINLVHRDHRESLTNADIEAQYEYIYWKYGATEVETGAKNLTLRRFEEKYNEKLINWAKNHRENNISAKYNALPEREKNKPEMIEAMKDIDSLINVKWPLVHYRSAARYLSGEKGDMPATGGTNWQQYLPPRFQRRVFFPDMWTPEELAEWGKR